MRREYVPQLGVDLSVDDRNCLNLGEVPYEPDLVAFYRAEIKPGDAVVDAGAMCGFYTVLFSQLVGPDGSVLAVEPNPASYDLLVDNVRQLGLSNAVLLNVALSDTNGHCLLSKAKVPGDCRSYPKDGWSSIEVISRRLDYFVPSRLDLVKMDIQGGEMLALAGMSGLLASLSPVIVTEFAPNWLVDAGCEPADYLIALWLAGYDLHTVAGEQHNDPEWWLTNIPGGHTGFTNIVCRRQAC